VLSDPVPIVLIRTGTIKTATDVVDGLRVALDAVLGLDPSLLSGDQLLELTRTFEAQARRTTAVQHRLIGELQRRNVAGEAGYRSTGAFLSHLLNLTRGNAAARVAAAAQFSPRHAVTGERLEPLFPAASAALANGGPLDRADCGDRPNSAGTSRTAAPATPRQY
jgi:hypothetical protein